MFMAVYLYRVHCICSDLSPMPPLSPPLTLTTTSTNSLASAYLWPYGEKLLLNLYIQLNNLLAL